jgi:hypothetical protein
MRKMIALYLGQLGARLTKLSKDQMDYISVPVERPYTQAHYSYWDNQGMTERKIKWFYLYCLFFWIFVVAFQFLDLL